MLHVLEDVQKRTEEDVCIALLVVKLGNRPPEAVLAGHRKGEPMHERLAFLLVPLGCKPPHALGYVFEERLLISVPGHVLSKPVLVIVIPLQ